MMEEEYPVGASVEVTHKGNVVHVGEVIGTGLDESDGYGSDYQRVRLQIPGFGIRVFGRTISFQGVVGEWKASARDMRWIGRVSLRLREPPA